MEKQRVKSIRALARGTEVLHLLQASGAMSLGDIHRETGLAKATLLRILLTCQEEGLVWQRIIDKAYVASYSLQQRARYLDDVSLLVSTQN